MIDRHLIKVACLFTVRGVLKDLNIVGNDTKLNNDTMQDYTCRIMDFFATVLALLKPLIGLK